MPCGPWSLVRLCLPSQKLPAHHDVARVIEGLAVLGDRVCTSELHGSAVEGAPLNFLPVRSPQGLQVEVIHCHCHCQWPLQCILHSLLHKDRDSKCASDSESGCHGASLAGSSVRQWTRARLGVALKEGLQSGVLQRRVTGRAASLYSLSTPLCLFLPAVPVVAPWLPVDAAFKFAGDPQQL